MYKCSDATLVEALTAWGQHEATGRMRAHLGDRLRNEESEYLDFILQYRAPLLSRLFSSLPVGCARVVFEAHDQPLFFLADSGSSLSQWSDRASPEEMAHFESLCRQPQPMAGSLIVATHVSGKGPMALYDGTHRAAAWRQRCREGKAETMAAFLVLYQRV